MLLRRSARCLICLLLVLAATSARAQLSGSIGISGETTNNVQSLDTTSPDQILLPAFTLSYDVPMSGSSKLTFSGSMGPSFYSVNPALSYNATIVGATGQFYLSNTDAISAASQQDSKLIQWQQSLPVRSSFMREVPMQEEYPTHAINKRIDTNDSLVDLASSALYTLSGELDSTDISPAGLTKKQVKEWEDRRDSISDAVITVADLLDSLGYSESTSEVMLKELNGLRAPLASLMPHLKGSKTDARSLGQAIEALTAAKPGSDYLPAASNPLGAQASVPDNKTVPPSSGKTVITSAPSESAASAQAPALTLVNATSRLREFGYSDISVREDLDDSSATTLATKLTIPMSWSSHKATSFSKSDVALFGGDTSLNGNPNDNATFSAGAALDLLPSTSFAIRAAYDFTHAAYPYDSVYSNSENRLTLTGRIGAGLSTVFVGEFAVGFRNYTQPLLLPKVTVKYDTIRGPKGKIIRIDPVGFDTTHQPGASKFDQFSFGAGVSQFIGDRAAVGFLFASNNNPTQRAYVTSAQLVQQQGGGKKAKPIRAAAQIADDEYTYDLTRLTLFGTFRTFADIDVGLDVSHEARSYAKVVGQNGKDLSQLVEGSGRTESGWYTNLSVSKLLPFSDRLFSIFNAAIIEAKLNLANVNASDALYSYSSSVFTLGATLAF